MDVTPSQRLLSANAVKFAQELTTLSKKHRIGIAGEPVLFVMEPDDDSRRYSVDGESCLAFE